MINLKYYLFLKSIPAFWYNSDQRKEVMPSLSFDEQHLCWHVLIYVIAMCIMRKTNQQTFNIKKGMLKSSIV
jgi:hypothetical protein